MEEYNKQIHVNQLGYPTDSRKLAILANIQGKFKVMDSKRNEAVYEGESFFYVGKEMASFDEASGDEVSYCDFTGVTEEGEYYIELEGQGRSYAFRIGRGIYTPVKDALLKGLYYQRCGQALEEAYAGSWSHGLCHTGKVRVYRNPEVELEVTGGWHDAGDYGRYVTAGAVSIADLLLSFELFGEIYGDDTGIPESGNKIPDVLDEARVELEWLLKVQNRENGGVYHKVTTKKFCGMIMPEDEEAEIFAMEESAVAAGDFAAIMAMAYRNYLPYDKEFACTMRAAAKRAWTWLTEHEDIPGFQNPADVITGEYGDPDSRDERFWAAVELYRVTGEEQYQKCIGKLLKTDVDKISLGWTKVGGYASFSYVCMYENKEQEGNKEAYLFLKEELLKEAEHSLSIHKADGYLVDILPPEYHWGSNMIIMNRAQLLIFAHLMTGEEKYYSAALEQLHYILGRNPMGISYITGVGKNSVNNIHHRPSAADGVHQAVPGLVSGGPDWYRTDDTAKKLIDEGTAPAKCFIDHQESYSTNEIAIYWNTPPLFVAAYADYMDYVEKTARKSK